MMLPAVMTMLMWQSKDVERTVGINCRYLGALQTSQLSKQDRVFLIEVALLLRYSVVETMFESRQDRRKRRSSIERDMTDFHSAFVFRLLLLARQASAYRLMLCRCYFLSYYYSAKKLELRRVLQTLCGAFERCSRVRL